VASGEIRRLGLYVDASIRSTEEGGRERLYRGPGAFGFMLFAAAVGSHFERFALIARATEDEAETPNPLPDGIELLPLPYYASLRQVGRVILAAPRTVAGMWRALDDLDAVWVSGVHPLGLALVALARIRGRRAVLLIRQDSLEYFRARLPSGRWRPLMAPIRLLDWCFRALARRLPTTVVGPDVARSYRAPRANVLEMRINLFERAQLASGPSVAGWDGPVELLTVGRIDPEKNPMLAAEMLAELERTDPGRYRLTWVGEGPLAEELRTAAERLGVSDRLTLAGFVPFGDQLRRRYRDANALVHISLTEGLPQVLFEAMSSGLPIVATEVGGVGEAIGGGDAALLVPPGDAVALADAVRRLAAEPSLRTSLAQRGLEIAGSATLERQSAAVAGFIRGEA
jgi:glycosyltransferase involved in cell wall biosynthesis